MTQMRTYQLEQLDAQQLVNHHLTRLKAELLGELHQKISDYMSFRQEVDTFLANHFGQVCTEACYQSRRSACCTKEGIITFFADMVINALQSEAHELDALLSVLRGPHTGFKCIYLGSDGCLWRVKPLVCEMFLCSHAEEAVLSQSPSLQQVWQDLRAREKSFRWPDRPVLFDDIERVFIAAGCDSPLMYLHNSPGLLRVKKRSDAYVG